MGRSDPEGAKAATPKVTLAVATKWEPEPHF